MGRNTGIEYKKILIQSPAVCDLLSTTSSNKLRVTLIMAMFFPFKKNTTASTVL